MFWRFAFNQQSSIDALLERPDFALTELLEEEDLLQEAKTQNRTLVDYLSKRSTVEELLNFILEVNDESPMEERYKYANIVSDLFSCDVRTMNETLLMEHEMLANFWNFLRRPAPLNPLHASLFSRVIGALLVTSAAQMVEFIQSQQNAVDMLLAHVGTSAIMDIVLKLVATEHAPEITYVISWMLEEGLIWKLANKFDPELPPEVHANASLALIDIMSTTQTIQRLGAVMAEIKGPDVIRTIVDYMLQVDGAHHASVLQHGLTLLTDILQRFMSSSATGEGREDLSELMNVLEPRIAAIVNLLSRTYPLPDDLQHTSLASSKILGSMRFHLIEFLITLMHMCPVELHQQLLKEKFVPQAVSLMFEFPLHNFLHMVVHDLIVRLLNREFDIMDDYILQLLTEARFMDRLVEAFRENDAAINAPQGARRGYMGHLTLLANRLVKFAEREDLSDAVRAFFTAPEWKEFETGRLADTNSTDSKPLGGHRPIPPSEPGAGLGLDSASLMPHHSDNMSDQFGRFVSHQLTGDLPDRLAGEDDDEDEDNAFHSEYLDEYEQDDLSFSHFGPARVASPVNLSDSDEEDGFEDDEAGTPQESAVATPAASGFGDADPWGGASEAPVAADAAAADAWGDSDPWGGSADVPKVEISSGFDDDETPKEKKEQEETKNEMSA